MMRAAMAMDSASVAPPALEAGTSELVISVSGAIQLD
jgi:predicted secreted protein